MSRGLAIEYPICCRITRDQTRLLINKIGTNRAKIDRAATILKLAFLHDLGREMARLERRSFSEQSNA